MAIAEAVVAPAKAQEIIEAALAIVAALEIEGDLRVPVFEAACRMMTPTTFVVPDSPVALPPSMASRLPTH